MRDEGKVIADSVVQRQLSSFGELKGERSRYAFRERRNGEAGVCRDGCMRVEVGVAKDLRIKRVVRFCDQNDAIKAGFVSQFSDRIAEAARGLTICGKT